MAAPESAGLPPAATAPARPRVVVLGDSLTAGYGLPSKDDAFPALLQRRLDSEGLGYEVVNMGVSGDTSAGGLRRLDWALDAPALARLGFGLAGRAGLAAAALGALVFPLALQATTLLTETLCN